MTDSSDTHAGERSLISRRTVTTAVAWSAPVVAMSVALPLSAASGAQVDLWSTARLPAAPNGVYQGENYYAGPRSCSFTYDFGNFGPDELPAGATITIGLPFASIWTTGSLSITSSGGYPLVAAGTSTEEIAPDPLAYRQLWHFTLGAALAAGASFTVQFTVPMNGTENTATNFYRVRTTSGFQVGPGVTDTNSSNNSDFSDNYAYFNHAAAG